MKKYHLVRFYAHLSPVILNKGRTVSLEDAKAHCKNPETSSQTCKTKKALEHTRRMGPWFDGYHEVPS